MVNIKGNSILLVLSALYNITYGLKLFWVPYSEEFYFFVMLFITIYCFVSLIRKKFLFNLTFHKLVLLFYLSLIIIEVVHSGVLNLYFILEHTCWILLPLLLVETGLSRKSFLTLIVIYLIPLLVLSSASVLNHFIDLPGATIPGTIFVDDAGYYGNRNLNGIVNSFSASIVICLIASYNKEHCWCTSFLKVCLLIFVLCVLFSGSRTSLIALIISLFILFMFKAKRKHIILFTLLTIFCIFFAIFFRIDSMLSVSNSLDEILDVITTRRYSIWKETIPLINNNILFGNGYGTLSEMANMYYDETSIIRSYGGILINSHNLIINILYNSGLITLLIFGLSVFQNFKNILLNRHKKNVIIAIPVFLGLIISLTETPILYGSSYINFMWWTIYIYSYCYIKDN